MSVIGGGPWSIPPTTRPPRPHTVTAASALLTLAGVVQLAVLPLTYWHQEFYYDAEKSFDPASGVAFAAFGVVGQLAADLVTALLAVTFLVLAGFTAVGVNGARIASWACGPFLVCCATVGILRTPRPLSLIYSPDDLDRIGELARERMPDWLEPLLVVLGAGAPLAMLVALLLLALPPANAFFRRPVSVAPGWHLRAGDWVPGPPAQG
ncbi:hypothetical protein ACGFJ5_12800 [Micromonospora echinaurantiaca]|uniref:hypothetical protein n=1 Tax=Micromonospora echinaurantiaca TaxID=47857 RepID=UPI003722924C